MPSNSKTPCYSNAFNRSAFENFVYWNFHPKKKLKGKVPENSIKTFLRTEIEKFLGLFFHPLSPIKIPWQCRSLLSFLLCFDIQKFSSSLLEFMNEYFRVVSEFWAEFYDLCFLSEFIVWRMLRESMKRLWWVWMRNIEALKSEAECFEVKFLFTFWSSRRTSTLKSLECNWSGIIVDKVFQSSLVSLKTCRE